MYYLPNGRIERNQLIIGQEPKFYIEQISVNSFYFPGDNIIYDLDLACIELYDRFREMVFPDEDVYYESLSNLPTWIAAAGHDSDFPMNCIQFEQASTKLDNEIWVRMLFLYDCQAMIGYLQNRIIESKSKLAQFYVLFCKQEPLNLVQNGVIFVSGDSITVVISLLSDLIVTLYSIMDLTTKIAYQFEHMPENYTKYPRQSSLKIQYGDKKKLRLFAENTIFEVVPVIKLIENLRHELIHNGYWEMSPKIYFQIINGEIAEKWIHMMDEDKGNIITFKNRKRFFSRGEKINICLPEICKEFWSRLKVTIEIIQESL
ncbi:hypothetical protein [Candidatus Oscillochloris fontis]|uniref:hypothetical protein n=1 Tax=Candidatus Oscillochloris fontis TaxID=2496868 RepID=UPI00101DBAC8|nr:hypothetical protein [Candidatus Oscillochloris fontis]